MSKPFQPELETAPTAERLASQISRLEDEVARLKKALPRRRRRTGTIRYDDSWMPRFVELVAVHGYLIRAHKALRKELPYPAYSTMHEALHRCPRFKAEVAGAREAASARIERRKHRRKLYSGEMEDPSAWDGLAGRRAW